MGESVDLQRVYVIHLEFEGVGYWDSSHIWYRDGLRDHMLGLTGFAAYGLKSEKFCNFGHKKGQTEFWLGLMGKGGFNPSNRSYMVCWKWF